MNNGTNLASARSSEPVSIFHALRLRERKLALEWLAKCRESAREGAERAARERDVS